MSDSPTPEKSRLRFDAVVFDMDGVLVDSEPVHLVSTVQLMEGELGIPFAEADNVEFLGSTDRHMFEVLRGRHKIGVTVEELIERRKTIYLELVKDGQPWRPGMLDLIADLADTGYRLAVASSALRRIIELVINDGKIAHLFETVVSGEDVEHPKPAPDIYLEAARQLALDPTRCVAIEDTELGVQSAKSAGMHVIAFPCTTTQDGDFSLADTRLESAEQIAGYLGSR